MGFIANTRVGVIRRAVRDGRDVHLLECPSCLRWCTLDDDQWQGRTSFQHTVLGRFCGYRETHNFAAAVAVTGGFRAV